MATKKVTTEKKEEVTKKVILSPHITEKASAQSSANAYTFLVAKNATKHLIASEIKREYKVTPRAINITTIQKQATFVRGRFGMDKGMKKAIVFLKKGDTISIA